MTQINKTLCLMLLILLHFNLKMIFACHGYGLIVHSSSHCVEDPIMKINGSVTLQDDCTLVLEGCLEITRPFKTAQLEFSYERPPMPVLEGSADLCEIMSMVDIPMFETIIKKYNVPTTCPVSKGMMCFTKEDGKISLSEYQQDIVMSTGNYIVKALITHEVGQSCIAFNASIEPQPGLKIN